jgi:hypothetical protein
MPVGHVIQYNVAGLSIHPFHQHVNSFQLAANPWQTASSYFQAGDWHGATSH